MTYQDLIKLRIKYKNKKIGLCHGVFDILHFGHILHFEESKKNCDFLVCSITDDKFVKKGLGQPYYKSNQRAKTLEGIKYVDYVHIERDTSAENVIKNLKPDIYFKGYDYKVKRDNLGNLDKEKFWIKKNNGKIYFTITKLSSSTKIFNWKKEIDANQKKVIYSIKNKYSEDYILKLFDNLYNTQINIIGEPIFDEYIDCEILGTTTKDPSLSARLTDKKIYNGGVLAIANLISEFAKKVNLITYFDLKHKKQINKINKNIKIFNIDNKQQVQQKTRYVTTNRTNKIFQTTNINKNNLNLNILSRIIHRFTKSLDNLAVCDFGLGLFKRETISILEKNKNKLSINVQTNSVNYGFNLLDKYKIVDMISLDLNEYRLYLKDKEIPYLEIIKKIKKDKIKFNIASVTLNKNGSVIFNKKNRETYYCPVFSDKIVDTTGCGDAYFIMSHALKLVNAPLDLNVFISNCYAGLYASVKGHEENIKKNYFLKYIFSLINV